MDETKRTSRTLICGKGKTMCDMTAVSIFLGSAKTAFLATLVILGIAILNATNFFTAPLNLGLMVLVISLSAVATGCYIAALALIDQCADVCGAAFSELRLMIITLLGLMAAWTAYLVTASLIIAFPWIGSATAGTALAWGFTFVTLATGLSEWRFAVAADNFNACRASLALATINIFVIVLAYGIVVAVAVVDGCGVFSGKLPLGVTF